MDINGGNEDSGLVLARSYMHTFLRVCVCVFFKSMTRVTNWAVECFNSAVTMQGKLDYYVTLVIEAQMNRVSQ